MRTNRSDCRKPIYAVCRKKESPMMNRSRTTSTTHAFRLHRLNGTLAALALLLLALVAPAGADPGNDNRAPDLGVCQDLQVEAGNKVAFHVYAVGVQIYRWNGTSWGSSTPEAVLYTDAGYTEPVGIHYGGPTWESFSGSLVRGAVDKRCPSPSPTAIDWLLLRAVFSQGPGIFDGVTFIQRVNTVGGKAPARNGVDGEVVRVPYTTEYFFYRATD
jgi:hypothetical protein